MRIINFLSFILLLLLLVIKLNGCVQSNYSYGEYNDKFEELAGTKDTLFIRYSFEKIMNDTLCLNNFDKDWSVLKEYMTIRDALLINGHTQNDIYLTIRFQESRAYEINDYISEIRKNINNLNDNVRLTIAKNCEFSEILSMLVKDKLNIVRAAVAKNPKTSSIDLNLLCSEFPIEVSHNPSVTQDIVLKIYNENLMSRYILESLLETNISYEFFQMIKSRLNKINYEIQKLNNNLFRISFNFPREFHDSLSISLWELNNEMEKEVQNIKMKILLVNLFIKFRYLATTIFLDSYTEIKSKSTYKYPVYDGRGRIKQPGRWELGDQYIEKIKYITKNPEIINFKDSIKNIPLIEVIKSSNSTDNNYQETIVIENEYFKNMISRRDSIESFANKLIYNPFTYIRIVPSFSVDNLYDLKKDFYYMPIFEKLSLLKNFVNKLDFNLFFIVTNKSKYKIKITEYPNELEYESEIFSIE